MLGLNPKLGLENGDGSILKIHSIFDTIQGEGIYSGMPAVFIRLSGCNLACKFCDTEFDTYKEVSITDIIAQIHKFSQSYKKLVVITGGEPFRQPISLLCEKLIQGGFKVQIETNGLLYRPIHKDVDIICSPKPTKLGYSILRSDLLKHLKALKFLVSTNYYEYRDIANVGQYNTDIKVYIQPMDEFDERVNNANLNLAMELVRKYNGILSLQLHKILQIE